MFKQCENKIFYLKKKKQKKKSYDKTIFILVDFNLIIKVIILLK